MYGKDVHAVRRAGIRYLQDDSLWKAYKVMPEWSRRTFGTGMKQLVRRIEAKAGMAVDGKAGPGVDRILRKSGAYDSVCDELLREYADEHPPPPVVLPVASLHYSLWAAYSEALSTTGLFSLGTYNPKSTLPSGAPSDHAVYPAYAFDIGFDPDAGWANPVARSYAEKTVKRLEVEYLILGDRIHIDGGWKTYTGGGHFDHIHVSGRR